MKPATQAAIDALNASPLLCGGGVLDRDRYHVIEDLAEAERSAASRAWERALVDIYNGVFIETIQTGLRSLRVNMGDALEEIHEALRPARRKLLDSKWPVLTRFAFEPLLGDCGAELEFAHVLEPVFFYPLMFPVFCAGHVPCGWKGKAIGSRWQPTGPADLPEGKLCVYYVPKR